MRRLSAENTNEYYKQAALAVGQMIAFNTTICTKKKSHILYHSGKREPPLLVYLSMMIYNKTRNLDLIEKLSHLGLSISKYHLFNIWLSLGNALLSTNKKNGCDGTDELEIASAHNSITWQHRRLDNIIAVNYVTTWYSSFF